MPPRFLAPVVGYLHSWIVSKRCLGVVAGFQRLLGVRQEAKGKQGAQGHGSGAEGHYYTYVTPIHCYFKLASVLGSELFYIVFLPLIIWQVDFQLGRSAIIFWNILFYIGNALKDLLCLPRPLNPPVLCLEKEYSAEYGLPSVHALGTFVPLYCLLKAVPHASADVAGDAKWSTHPYWRLWLLFTVSVCSSRLYLGVHSMPDLVAGAALGTLLLGFGVNLGDGAEAFAMHHPWGGAVLCVASLLMVLAYPVPAKPTPTLGYTVSVMGAGGGVLLASRHLLHSSSDSAKTVLATLSDPPPFSRRVVLRVALGMVVLGVIKTLAKPVIQTVLRPVLPRKPSPPPSENKGRKGKQQKPAEVEGSEFVMTGGEVLGKYLNYFAIGWAVVHAIPALWAAVGL